MDPRRILNIQIRILRLAMEKTLMANQASMSKVIDLTNENMV